MRGCPGCGAAPTPGAAARRGRSRPAPRRWNSLRRRSGLRSGWPGCCPMFVRIRHLPLLLARGSPRDQDPCPQQRTGPKPCRRCSAGTSLPISGCLAPSRRGNTALRSQASAHAPEQPVLDVRNQPDNYRRRRTERRLLSGTFAVVVMLAAGRWRRRGIAGLADAPPAAAGCRCSRVGDQARATWTLAGSSLPPR